MEYKLDAHQKIPRILKTLSNAIDWFPHKKSDSLPTEWINSDPLGVKDIDFANNLLIIP